MNKRNMKLLLVAALLTSAAALAEEDAARPHPLPMEELRTFVDILNKVKADYLRPVDDKELLRRATAGMLSSLDPYSAYVTAKDMALMTTPPDSNIGGLGLEFQTFEGITRVVSPIDGTPAALAGIKPGELIRKIGGENVTGLDSPAILARLRGPVGTAVTLTLANPATGETREVPMTREHIVPANVKVSPEADGILKVRIAQFTAQTGDEVRRELTQSAAAAPDLRGLVLDLRSNPGGLLKGCLDTANIFLKAGATIIEMQSRIPENNRVYAADALVDEPRWKNVPMALLLNRGSAACSEIIAAAFQDNGRALLVGARTFGKATVQTIMPLQNGDAIKITTAEWISPKGHTIDGKGVEPDVTAGDDEALAVAVKRLQQKVSPAEAGRDI